MTLEERIDVIADMDRTQLIRMVAYFSGLNPEAFDRNAAIVLGKDG